VILVRRTSYFHQTKSVDEEPLASGRPKAYWKHYLADLFSSNLMVWKDLHSSSHSKE
jgi:hypothetical protein